MESDNRARAVEYYTLVGKKDVEGVKNYLHPDVEFYGPLAQLKGKELVVEATHNFMKSFSSLEIQAQFAAQDQAMIVYTVDIPGISKEFPGASLLYFKDGKIVRIQLFYDGSCFVEKGKEIFKHE